MQNTHYIIYVLHLHFHLSSTHILHWHYAKCNISLESISNVFVMGLPILNLRTKAKVSIEISI